MSIRYLTCRSVLAPVRDTSDFLGAFLTVSDPFSKQRHIIQITMHSDPSGYAALRKHYSWRAMTKDEGTSCALKSEDDRSLVITVTLTMERAGLKLKWETGQRAQ